VNDFAAEVELIPQAKEQPDMVFTANAGIAHEGKFVPSRFQFQERAGEEPFFIEWFASHGYEITDLEGHQEGAGDALFLDTPEGKILFAAFGFRTDSFVHAEWAEAFNEKVVSMQLIDPRFYHLDTCFCPMPGGRLFWFPPAFSEASQKQVLNLVPSELRFAASEEDGHRFSCNAVAVPGHLVTSYLSDGLSAWLREQGFMPHVTPLGEFLKAGGGAKCLTLRIDSAFV
jgi:N-dimethylarginine dimethylaminohydrolase